ncbi:MAG: ATP-binding cassette domain-containing protein [Hyphomonadaceae bacterium]
MSFFVLSGLSAGYGGRRVLFDFDLSLPERGLTLLVGANGSGKSTLFKALFGQARVFEARSFDFLDRKISPGARVAWFRRRCGYVPQYRNVFDSLTVEENLSVALGGVWRARRTELEAVVGASPFSRLRDRAGNLSGGQKHALALALALDEDKRVLLLDEPLASLDGGARTRVASIIGKLAETKAVLVAEHRFSVFAGVADKIVALKQGRVAIVLENARTLARDALVERVTTALLRAP